MDSNLNRKLSKRHLQMIALSTAIGTGLFYGSNASIAQAGPAVMLSYLIAGIICFFIVRMLGEMSVEEPVSGSFSYYATKYWGEFPGFLAGWNYCFLYIFCGIAELSATSIYLSHWFPNLPRWIPILVFIIIITVVNLMTVKVYAEVGFWLTSIKILAIIGMILLGSFYIFTNHHATTFASHFENLWIHGGFFPNGIQGMIIAMAPVMFSLGGLELIGVAAGEVKDPDKTIPAAINQLICCILLFYCGTMFVLMTLWPWDEVGQQASPFVQIFAGAGSKMAANILNFVVLTVALGAYNSISYSTARMLYSMAMVGNAPKVFKKISARNIPVNGILFSSGITLMAAVLNYFFPDEIFTHMMAIVIGGFIISWMMIVITHLKFRHHCDLNGIKPKFKALFYPFANYLSLAFFTMLIIIMAFNLKILSTFIIIPLWILIIVLGYRFKRK